MEFTFSRPSSLMNLTLNCTSPPETDLQYSIATPHTDAPKREARISRVTRWRAAKSDVIARIEWPAVTFFSGVGAIPFTEHYIPRVVKLTGEEGEEEEN